MAELLDLLKPHAPAQGPPLPQSLPGWPGVIKDAFSRNFFGTPFPREAYIKKIKNAKGPEVLKNLILKIDELGHGIADSYLGGK